MLFFCWKVCFIFSYTIDIICKYIIIYSMTRIKHFGNRIYKKALYVTKMLIGQLKNIIEKIYKGTDKSVMKYLIH